MYEYKIPCINGKPIVSIPLELRQNAKEMVYGSDEIKIVSDELVDPMLYDPNVKVIDLSIGQEIKSLLGDYLNPPVADVIVTKDDTYVYAMRPSNNYKGYIILDKGEAGVSTSSPGSDTEVVLDALEYLQNYQGIPVLCLNGEFFINKVTIKSPVKITGSSCVINAVDPTTPVFEVFNGNTADNKPENVILNNMIINGAVAFRYCKDWQIVNCNIDNSGYCVILERTWGSKQTIERTEITGTPPSGDGLISIVTPVNDDSNDISIVHTAICPNNKSGYGIYIHPQYNNLVFHEFNLYDVHCEGVGTFLGGANLQGIYIKDCVLVPTEGAINVQNMTNSLIDGGKYTSIQIQSNGSGTTIRNINFITQLIYKNNSYNIKSNPLIKIGMGNYINIEDINFHDDYIDSDVPIISIGSSGWFNYINIYNINVVNFSAKSFLELGNSGKSYGTKLVNCTFVNLNAIKQYTSCYIYYSNGIPVIFDGCKISDLNYYTISNDTSKVLMLPALMFLSSGMSVSLGDDTYGSPTVFTPPAGFISNFNLILHITAAAGDTVYAKVTTVFENAGETTGVIKEVDNSSGTASVSKDISLDTSDLLSLWKNNDRLLAVKVYGNSVTGNSSSSVTFDIFGSS